MSQKKVQPRRPVGIDDVPTDVWISVSDAWTNKIDLDEQYQPNVIGIDTLAGHNTVQGLLTDGDNQFQLEDFRFIPSLIAEENDVDLCRIPDVEEVR